MHKDDPPEVKAKALCHHKADRKKKMMVLLNIQESSTSVGTNERVRFFTKNQFMGHFMVFECRTKTQATALWIKATRPESGVETRMNKLNEVTVAVELPLEVVREKRESKKRALQITDMAGSSDEEELVQQDFTKRLKADIEADDLGEVLGISKVMKGSCAFSEEDLASELGSIISSGTSGRSATTVGTMKVVPATEDEVQLSIVKARSSAKTLVKQATADCLAKKTSPKQILDAVIKKLGSDHLDVTTLNAVGKIDDLVIRLDELKKIADTTETWSGETYKTSYLDVCKKNYGCQGPLSVNLEDC